MSWRDNLRQAARQIVGTGEPEAPQPMKDLLDKQSEAEPVGDGVEPDSALEGGEFGAEFPEQGTGSPFTPPPEPERIEVIPLMASLSPPRRKTVIAEDTVARGPIEAKGGVEIYGEMLGDLTSEDDILISGRMIGGTTSRRLEMSGGKMQGDVVAADDVQIDEDSILLGDVKAGSLRLQGRIRGGLTIASTVAMTENAVVLGDITAQGISVAEGAAIQGQLRIAVKDIGAAFEDDAL